MGKIIERVRQRQEAEIRRQVARLEHHVRQAAFNSWLRARVDELPIANEKQLLRDQLVTGFSIQQGDKRIDPAQVFPDPPPPWLWPFN